MIGKGAEEHLFHIKKLEPPPFLLDSPSEALISAISDKPDYTRMEAFIMYQMDHSKEWREEYVNAGFFTYPEEYVDRFLKDDPNYEQDYEGLLPILSFIGDKYSLADCTGVCIFWTGFFPYDPISVEDHIQLVAYATGQDMDEAGAMAYAKRCAAMTRAYNTLMGIRREDDTIPERYFQDPPLRVRFDRRKFDKMISDYYELRGWTVRGNPSKNELERLGLVEVFTELERRGLL
jgi:aldehyde:ferredoxin oxidoreductase